MKPNNLTLAQKSAIAAFTADNRILLEAVVCIIDGRLVHMGEKRVTSTEIAEALSGFSGCRRWADPAMMWRTRTIISTAFRFGAFQPCAFELRPGVGVRLKTDVILKKKPKEELKKQREKMRASARALKSRSA